MKPKLSNYRLEFKTSSYIDDDVHPDDVPLKVNCEILFVESDVLNAKYEKVGILEAIFVPVNDAREKGYDISEVFDAVSEELLDCYEAIFDPSEKDIKEDIREDFEVITDDVLYISRVEILPEHRGRGLGLAVVKKVIERFGPIMGLVTIMPSPALSHHNPEWESRMKLSDFTSDQGTAIKKLHVYFEQLGFRQIEDTNVWAVCTAFVMPTLDTICPDLM